MVGTEPGGKLEMDVRVINPFIGAIEAVLSKEIGSTVRSAIAELPNTVTGTASIELENQGLVVDISPPAVIQGVDAQLTTLNTPRVAVPLETKLGPVTVEIALSRVRSTSE